MFFWECLKRFIQHRIRKKYLLRNLKMINTPYHKSALKALYVLSVTFIIMFKATRHHWLTECIDMITINHHTKFELTSAFRKE